VWREAQWQALPCPPRTSGFQLAVHPGGAPPGRATTLGTIPYQHVFIGRLEADTLATLIDLGGNDYSDVRVDHLASHGDDLVYAWSVGSPGGYADCVECLRRDGTVPEVLARNAGLSVRGSASVPGRLYVADLQSVLREDDLGLREFARVAGGEILGAVHYNGAIYICGSFTEVNRVPSFRIARFTP